MRTNEISLSGQVIAFSTSRGALLLIGSQAIAIFVGFAIHVGLTRFLSPEFYGLYAVTISVLMWGELVVAGIVWTAFPKVLSEGSVSAKEVWHWVWRGYLPFWIGLWLVFSALSWGIASLLRDERLVLLLLVASLELPFYGIYMAGRSLLQGLMAYGWMSILSSLWALLRLFVILALVLSTKSVLGAMAGNTLAVAITAFLTVAILRPFLSSASDSLSQEQRTSHSALSTHLGSAGASRSQRTETRLSSAGASRSQRTETRLGSAGASRSQRTETRLGSAGASRSQRVGTSHPALRTTILLLIGVGLPTLVLALLDQVFWVLDLWILKRVAEPEFSGFYGAARFFALALVFLASGLGSAWFPAMCHELGKGEREKAKGLLSEAMRVLILGLLPFAVVVWATVRPLSVLLFSGSFEATAEPMRWLVIATSLFVFMCFMRGALIADNEFRLPVTIAILTTALDFLLCYFLIPRYGMLGAAWATTITSVVGFIVIWFFTALRFGDFIPITTLVRTIIASFVLWLIAVFWPTNGLMLLVQYLLLGVVYVLLLVLLGELKSGDWKVLKVVATNVLMDITAILVNYKHANVQKVSHKNNK